MLLFEFEVLQYRCFIVIIYALKIVKGKRSIYEGSNSVLNSNGVFFLGVCDCPGHCM